MEQHSRRRFLRDAAIVAAACTTQSLPEIAETAKSPFRVAVINDEISPDFDHACYVASHDFGMSWIELRSMWGKNVMDLSAAEIEESKKILDKYNLQVTDIASPLFKTDWPDAPHSPYGSKGDLHGAAATTFKQQDEILEKSIALAKQFKTTRIRGFDFWRLDDVTPYRAAIDEKLRAAAEALGKQGLLLALNWDPANAVMRGELDAFPGGWDVLPKNRIHHCHVKNAVKNAEGKIEWSPVGKGFIDWAEQFRALKKIGYHEAVSLETHWHGAGTPEESSRVSWAGMKQALQDAHAL